jgi:hypothetical protein
MRAILSAVAAAGLLVAFAGAGDVAAKSHKKPAETYGRHDSYAARYPTATPRQLRNARAYDRGEYYEQDSNAHPAGSRGWWALKERESGGDMRP